MWEWNDLISTQWSTWTKQGLGPLCTGAWSSVFPCHRSGIWRRRAAAPAFHCLSVSSPSVLTLLLFPVSKPDLLCLKQGEGQAREDNRNETLSGRVLQLRQRQNSGEMLLPMSSNRAFTPRSKSPISVFPEKKRETDKQAGRRQGRKKEGFVLWELAAS